MRYVDPLEFLNQSKQQLEKNLGMSLEQAQKDIQTRDHLANDYVHAYGYSQLFEMRARKYQGYLRLTNFLSVLVPVSAGAGAIAYSTEFINSWMFSTILVPLAFVQTILSVLALSARWQDKWLESTDLHKKFFKQFNDMKRLSSIITFSDDERRDSLKLLDEFSELMSDMGRLDIKDHERRRGMRYSLRQFSKECAGCHITPKSVVSTECDVCGYFDIKSKLKSNIQWTSKSKG